MPSIPALGRQRQAGLCEIKASLVYGVIAWATQRKTKQKENKRQEAAFLRGASALAPTFLP